MKKIALLATVALVVGLFSTQALAYRGGQGYRADCPRYSQDATVTAEQQAAFQKFFDATKDQRNKMFADRAEMRALMRADNPDAAKVRQLAESMAATHDQIAAKAQEMGVEAGPGYGRGGRAGRGGYGQGGNDCPHGDGRYGQGSGKGRGQGRR